MENKMQYKCAICGKTYENLKDRIACESKCLVKQEEEAKKAAEAKRHAEQAADKARVDELFAAAYKARDEYVKNYGAYSYVYKEPVTNSHDFHTVGDMFKFFM